MKTRNALIKAHALHYMLQFGQKYVLSLYLLPLVVIIVAWPYVSAGVALVWLTASFANATARLIVIQRGKAIPISNLNVPQWGWYATVTSTISGILWGLSAIVFFVPGSVGLQVFIFSLLYALLSVSLTVHAYWIAAYFGFAIPVALGLVVALILTGEETYLAFSFLTILYMLVFAKVAVEQRRMIIESLQLRFENNDLMVGLQAQKDAAEAANNEKSRFLAAASHDLRQPLHAIGLFCDSLAKNHNRNAEERALIQDLNKAVSSLNSLLLALLDISKLDAGVLEPNMQHFSISQLLKRIGAEYEPQAHAKGLNWELATCTRTVYSDPVLLEAALRNIISNALRYTHSGFVRVHIDSDEDRLFVAVSDTGIGIPPDKHREVFKEFAQLNNPERDNAKGVGLGLAIVDRLSKLLDVDLSMRSILNVGSTFTLKVPLGDVAKVRLQDLSQPLDYEGQQCVSVLVIENHLDVRCATLSLLNSWGYETYGASGLEEATVALKQNLQPPDIVITDFRLPDGTFGIGVARALQEQTSKPFSTIIVTGDTSEQQMIELHKSGFRVLHKPVPPAKLRAAILSAMVERRKCGRLPPQDGDSTWLNATDKPRLR